MPYTNPWSVLIPLGTSPAAQLDTFIQQVRLDISERCNTMIGGAGSFSNDPVIDGITAKSLTQLTTELATKTTVTGLVAGQLIKANTPTTITNSAYTETQLGILLNPPITDNNTTTNGIKFTQALVPGTYMVTFAVNSPSNINSLLITGSAGFLPAPGVTTLMQEYPNGMNSCVLTSVIQVLVNTTFDFSTAAGPNTTNGLIIKRLL